MPISRQKIVQSKYLLCFLLFGLFLVVGVTFSDWWTETWGDALFTNLLVAAMSLLMSVIALPCMFKWGAQRGRLVIVLLCGVAGCLNSDTGYFSENRRPCQRNESWRNDAGYAAEQRHLIECCIDCNSHCNNHILSDFLQHLTAKNNFRAVVCAVVDARSKYGGKTLCLNETVCCCR